MRLNIQTVYPKIISNAYFKVYFTIHLHLILIDVLEVINTLTGPSNKVYVFNMTTGINEWKTLTKHISCKCICKFGSRKCNSNQKWNNDKCWWECKNPKKIISAKNIFGILLHVVAKM